MRTVSRWRIVVSGAGSALLLNACSIQHRPKTQFAGKLTSDNQACPQTQGTLVIQNEQVIFSPSDSTWTLQGKAVDDRVTAARSRPGADHKLYTTTLTATRTDDRVTGTYSTPACTYAVNLRSF